MDNEKTRMKEILSKYEAPVLRIFAFSVEDVLTASTDVGGEWPEDWVN